MRVFATAIVLALLCCACQKAPAPLPPKTAQDVQKDDRYAQELEEIKKNIKGDLRIKLKRDGKGESYSWEITGKDPREILKANDVLARKLINR
jgi:outer membrane biogenesis lipoprotein LolB